MKLSLTRLITLWYRRVRSYSALRKIETKTAGVGPSDLAQDREVPAVRWLGVGWFLHRKECCRVGGGKERNEMHSSFRKAGTSLSRQRRFSFLARGPLYLPHLTRVTPSQGPTIRQDSYRCSWSALRLACSKTRTRVMMCLYFKEGTSRRLGQLLGYVPDLDWRIVGVGDFGIAGEE